MSRAALRPVDVPAKLGASMGKAIAADFPDRGMSGSEDYAQPHIRTDAERLINGDRDGLALARLAEDVDRLTAEVGHIADKMALEHHIEETKGAKLEQLRALIRGLTYGEKMEWCEAITGHPDFKPPTTWGEFAVILYRDAISEGDRRTCKSRQNT
jgi:hypothetical protein